MAALNPPPTDPSVISKRIVDIIMKESGAASFARARGLKGSNLTTFSADDQIHEQVVSAVTEKFVKKYPGETTVYHYNGLTGDGPSLKAAFDFCVRQKRKLFLISHFSDLCPVNSADIEKSEEAVREVLRVVAKLETRACTVAVFALVDFSIPLNGAVNPHDFIKLDEGPE